MVAVSVVVTVTTGLVASRTVVAGAASSVVTICVVGGRVLVFVSF